MITILKNKFLPLLTVILGLGCVDFAEAQQSRLDSIPAIQIKNTASLQGRYIHVLYAIGRRLPLEMTRTPQLDILRAAKSIQVSGPSVQLPGLSLERITFRGSYNLIVFAVSNSPEIKWANPDDHVHVDYSILNIIEKPVIDEFINQQGAGAVYSFSL